MLGWFSTTFKRNFADILHILSRLGGVGFQSLFSTVEKSIGSTIGPPGFFVALALGTQII